MAGAGGILTVFRVRVSVGEEYLGIYLPFLAGFLAVFALSRNALAVGALLAPGLRIFSPDPAAMRSRFA